MPEERALPEALRIRLGIFIALKRWESAAAHAEGMIAKVEQSAAMWLHGAFAIRRARSLAEANTFLLRGEALLKDHATFPFNLACDACQLGDMPACKARLTGPSSSTPIFEWRRSMTKT